MILKPPFNLKCEYLTNPNGIDVLKPRFSWELSHKERNQIQSAYEIIISDNMLSIRNEMGNIWSSGKILSR